LQVGKKNPLAGEFLRSRNAKGAAFITAYNPASLPLGPVHNTMADRALRQDIKLASAQAFIGSGVDPDGKWPAETSYLITGLSRGDAENLARRYGQYAMLWADADGMVNLVETFNLDKAARYPLKVPPFARVEIGFEWGYEWTTLRLSPSEWRHILEGEEFIKRSRQANDGEWFWLYWSFRNGTDLYVSYGDDGGTAYDGKLIGVNLTLEARK
jgi:hypothetical protein